MATARKEALDQILIRSTKETPKHEPIYLDRSLILVDDARNVRNFGKPISKDDPETIALAKLIARDGQLKPVTVRRSLYASFRDHKHPYVLDTGFRRMCALDLLERDVVFAAIVEGDETEVDRIARVVGENEGHKALTPAELAFACAAMRDAAKESGEPLPLPALAEKIGRSESYCETLLLCHDNLIPEILDAWKGKGRAMPLPVSEASRFARMGAPRQAESWKAFLGATKEAKKRGRKPLAGGPRPCSRADLERLAEQARDLESVLVDGRYVTPGTQKERKLVRAAVRATLAHALDRDSALPFRTA